MKRVHDAAWPVIGLGAVAISSWLLFKDLRGLSFASLKSALFSISLARWLLAIGSTSLAYAALAWYDQIALLHLGRRLSWRYVAVASFTAYALAHNIGASVLSGAVVRYRAYSEKGLSVGEIGVLVAFCSFTFALGAATVGGFCLLFHPELAKRFAGAPLWLGQAVACGACRGAEPLRRRRPPAFSSAQDRPLRACLPASASRGATTARRPSGAGRRVRHHLFRAPCRC